MLPSTCLVLGLSACGGDRAPAEIKPSTTAPNASAKAPREEATEPAASAVTSASASSASSASATASAALLVPAGAPRTLASFELPQVEVVAAAGDAVLAPSRSMLDGAFEYGLEAQTFVFYAGTLLKRETSEVTVKSKAGALTKLPQALVVALDRGAKAKPGDVLLTAWASGAGMQRAIAVEGGTPESPRVRYLDLAWTIPDGSSQRDDTLPPGSFKVLRGAGEVGGSFACREGKRHTRQIAVAADAARVLGLGFGGRLRSFVRGDCSPLPVAPKLAKGDTVQAPIAGSYVPAKVEQIEAPIGRVTVTVESGGKKRSEVVAIVDVAKELPAE